MILCRGEEKRWSLFNSLEMTKREEYWRWFPWARNAAIRSTCRAHLACITYTRRK